MDGLVQFPKVVVYKYVEVIRKIMIPQKSDYSRMFKSNFITYLAHLMEKGYAYTTKVIVSILIFHD